jgi:NAD(P)-dependent dehydrogenase (short-subunit alcohol dehydrogenase family)
MLNRFVGGNDTIKAGLVSTVPLKRSGKPEEIAQAVLFLASEKGSFGRATSWQPMAAKRRADKGPDGSGSILKRRTQSC